MARYKLIALDMDGTLLDDKSQVTRANRAAIAEARRMGIHVVLSTGRGMQSLLPYYQDLELDSPIVAVNGSEVWRSEKELDVRQLMPYEEVMALRDIAVREDAWYWVYATTGVFNKENWSAAPQASEALWLKFGYYTEDAEQLERIRESIGSVGVFEMTNSHPCNIELNPVGVSKASGLRKVCQLLGLSMDEVVAMGDSLNDAAMLKEAGLGIAMGNAQDEVKQLADAVTGTNEESGVAQAIRKYMLIS
jgi:5-amino-6-(5-phospho-D-ribitylamino)uracil phosphatase